MTAGCALLRMLRAGGPVRVPFRMCCVAAMLECNKSGVPAEPPLCPDGGLDDPRLEQSVEAGAVR